MGKRKNLILVVMIGLAVIISCFAILLSHIPRLQAIRFYRAFARNDINALDRVIDDDTMINGTPYSEIREAFRLYFENPKYDFAGRGYRIYPTSKRESNDIDVGAPENIEQREFVPWEFGVHCYNNFPKWKIRSISFPNELFEAILQCQE